MWRFLSSHNFVVQCSINLEINKALQLGENNTWKELEGEMIRNNALKKGVQLLTRLMVELKFSAIIAEELHINESV